MTKYQISIAFQTDRPLAAYGPLAAQAEEYGFDGVSVYNDLLYQPAWLPLLEIARHTRQVRIGPAAVNPFDCHPINLAGNIALIDEASGGRAYLGIARGGWPEFLGLKPERPLTALREAIECIRHLLAQAREPYQGEVFHLAGGDSLRWEILRPDIPILLGSWGAKTVRACLEHISEVKIGGTANPNMASFMRSVIAEAAPTCGRNAAAIGVAIGAVTVVDRDGDAARRLARRKVALYVPVVAQLDKTLEIDPDALARIQAAAANYDFDEAGRHIPDDLLSRFAFAGTPEQVAEHAATVFAAGASRVEFGAPHGLTSEQGMRLLGEQVLLALRS